jgi:hypothetical protein
MKKNLLVIIGFLLVLQCYSQVPCTLEGQTFVPASKPLFTYSFPSDTTDELITDTYISITNDSMYYADVLSYRKNCISMYIVKAALKDLKFDLGFKIDEMELNAKKKTTGFLLTVYASINHNVFYMQQGSKKFGWTNIPGNMVTIICPDRESANFLANEIDKRVNVK